MPTRKYLALALLIGMLLGYGWQSIVTPIVLLGIYLFIKKMAHFFLWALEKLKKIIGFN